MATTPQRNDAMFVLSQTSHIAIAKKIIESPLHLAWGTLPEGFTGVWTDVAPVPNPVDTRLIKEVGRRLVTVKKYVVPNPNGEITTTQGNFSESRTPTRTVFIQVNHDVTDASDQTIYQVGLFIDTVAKAGKSNQSWLLPTEVEDQGYLITLANVAPIVRNAATKEVRQLVLNF